ncbi:hypothetical protein JYU34_010531 [Plutella xylostella]|uniref:Uncharacterized protein n=1 Tax=Plutella xylostella TaxID=51655 RepID=A0ABQ7QIP2_PLUXY|nr:hypothetical protein JYU34_010531 [Plutella xylostella]
MLFQELKVTNLSEDQEVPVVVEVVENPLTDPTSGVPNKMTSSWPRWKQNVMHDSLTFVCLTLRQALQPNNGKLVN